jgi:hypothetical protein
MKQSRVYAIEAFPLSSSVMWNFCAAIVLIPGVTVVAAELIGSSSKTQLAALMSALGQKRTSKPQANETIHPPFAFSN